MSGPDIQLITPETPEDWQETRLILRDYANSLNFDLCFQGFEQELSALPGAYAPPRGRLLLARDGETLAGCGALRPLSQEICEMKRLYVRDAFRGRGAGKLLAETLIAEARSIGYTAMRLDTLPSMTAAIPLYRSLGFSEISPYTTNPVPGALFMEKRL